MMIGPLPSPCFLPFLSEPAKFPCLSGRALCPRLSCPLPPREAAGAIQNRRGLVFLAGPAAVQPAVCVASGLCTFGAAQRFAPCAARGPANYTAYANGILLRRTEEHTSELQSLMRISYAVFC